MTESTAQDYRIRILSDRIIEIIDNENKSLGKNPQFNIDVSNNNKGRCLYELSMLFQDLDTEKLSPVSIQKLREVHEKLTFNACHLEACLEAARTMANLLKNTMKNMDTDGTYSNK
ncbi:hypothetical protein RL73_04710 [Liberibacter crescens]|nr:hypothetical protein RL73_04710 [Liberibacter crescens]